MGLNMAEAPVGKFVADKVTAAAVPAVLVTVIVEVVEPPLQVEPELGLAEMEKLKGRDTVTVVEHVVVEVPEPGQVKVQVVVLLGETLWLPERAFEPDQPPEAVQVPRVLLDDQFNVDDPP